MYKKSDTILESVLSDSDSSIIEMLGNDKTHLIVTILGDKDASFKILFDKLSKFKVKVVQPQIECFLMRIPLNSLIVVLNGWFGRRELGLFDTSLCNKVDRSFLSDLYERTYFKPDSKMCIGLGFLGWLALKGINLQKIELTIFRKFEVFYPNLYLNVFNKTVELVISDCSINNLTDVRLGKMLNACSKLTSLTAVRTEAFTDELVVMYLTNVFWKKMKFFRYEGKSLSSVSSMQYIANTCLRLVHVKLIFVKCLHPSINSSDWVVKLLTRNKNLKHLNIPSSVPVGLDALRSLAKNPIQIETVQICNYCFTGPDEGNILVRLLSSLNLITVELGGGFKFQRTINQKSVSFGDGAGQTECCLLTESISHILQQVRDFTSIKVAICTTDILDSIQSNQTSLEVLDIGRLSVELYLQTKHALEPILMASKFTHFSVGVPSGNALMHILPRVNCIKLLTVYNMTSLSGVKHLLERFDSVRYIKLIKSKDVVWEKDLEMELVAFSECRGGIVTIVEAGLL
jgi:hypothetical protein